MYWRLYSGDLTTVINPPTGTIWIGVPDTVAYIGKWCTKDSTGLVVPIGGNITVKTGVVTITTGAGTKTLTFGVAFPVGATYTTFLSCTNSKGQVTCHIIEGSQTINGFQYYTSANGILNYYCSIITDSGATT